MNVLTTKDPEQGSTRPAEWFVMQPVFFACLAFCGGVFFADAAWRPDTWWIVAFTVITTSGVYFCRRHDRTVMAVVFSLLVFIPLGALDAQLEQEAHDSGPDITAFTQGAPLIVTGHIIRHGLLRTIGHSEKNGTPILEQSQVLDIETEAVETEQVKTE